MSNLKVRFYGILKIYDVYFRKYRTLSLVARYFSRAMVLDWVFSGALG